MCIHLPFQYKKATQALNYFALREGGCVNKMKAIKLIFFADRYHIRKYGRPITNDEYLAMDFGPVNSGVKDIAEMSGFLGQRERVYASEFIQREGEYEVKSIAPVEQKVFSRTDLESLEFAWKAFGKYDQFALADITHEYPEWKRHEQELKHSSRVRMDFTHFLDDPKRGFEECCSLSPEEKQDRLEEIREISHLQTLLS
jgi:uncharacterized phage-associated protein